MTIRNRTYPYIAPPAAADVPTPVSSPTDNPDPQMSDVIRVRTYPYVSPPAAVEVPIPGPPGDDATVNAANVAAVIHSAAGKAIPVDADEMPLTDSAASYALKKLTWANIKASLLTYFSDLFASTAQGELADTAAQKSANLGDLDNFAAARNHLNVRQATYTPIMSNRTSDTPIGDDPNGAHFILLASSYSDTDFHLPDFTAFKYPITLRNNKSSTVTIKASVANGEAAVTPLGTNGVTVFWAEGAAWNYYQFVAPDLSNYATKGFAIGMSIALG